ncbi:RNA polymerase I-specific transcription initiation factor RRN3 [Galemys pyrenaicus]|uniref:RNA polymerase I-specific transcription initiation factor RRN3 n=1 Tax=Galemys pyrenaicus TaxID=202257 RepID=A0A8J6DQZ7_GALPY|nr:RNA polymerase I-specific transcription initiation factor RRN3 [Galemys pyrenaicus]
MLGSCRTEISDVLTLESDLFNFPLIKTVQFGGTVTEHLTNSLLISQCLNRNPTVEGCLSFLGDLGSNRWSSFDHMTKMIIFLQNLTHHEVLHIINSKIYPSNIMVSYANTGRNISIYSKISKNPGMHEILELITEKLFELDVDASQQDTEDEETAVHTASGMDATEKTVGYRGRQLLSLLCPYIKDVCYADGKSNYNRIKSLYQDLITIVHKLLLATHTSCYIEFFMFYLCSFKLGFEEAFLEHLQRKLQALNNPAIIRQAAKNYKGNFLVRGPIITVTSGLDLLVNRLHIYHNQDLGTKAIYDYALHGPFRLPTFFFHIFVLDISKF